MLLEDVWAREDVQETREGGGWVNTFLTVAMEIFYEVVHSQFVPIGTLMLST